MNAVPATVQPAGTASSQVQASNVQSCRMCPCLHRGNKSMVAVFEDMLAVGMFRYTSCWRSRLPPSHAIIKPAVLVGASATCTYPITCIPRAPSCNTKSSGEQEGQMPPDCDGDASWPGKQAMFGVRDVMACMCYTEKAPNAWQRRATGLHV